MASKALDILKRVGSRVPGLAIMLIMNLFLSVSFGLSTFPSQWIFPSTVSRAIGVHMFIFSTALCQLVLTSMSHFDSAVGMTMVENIPFWHAISKVAISYQGMSSEDTFSTVIITIGLSSILVGFSFYMLGKFEVGAAVYFVPKYVITGCIGGIGIFIFITGLDASSGLSWDWYQLNRISEFGHREKLPLWLVALGLAVLLQVLQSVYSLPLLPSFFFMAIPPFFYLIVLIFRIPLNVAHDRGWLFENSDGSSPFAVWGLLRFDKVHWKAVGECLPTILALNLFSLMHAPINIPSLSASTGRSVDMNNELIAHGLSNIIVGLCGGLQNYLCYSDSILYWRCQGGGKISGYLLAFGTFSFLFFGASAAYYIPRCLAGCLLMHLGIELVKEALWDSRTELDSFEYASVIILTVMMTFFGMTAGLVFGVICAAVTFTAQASKKKYPIRGFMTASTLRSSKWRTALTASMLDKYARNVKVVQLQGYLFFGNAITVSSNIEKMLTSETEVRILLLDFTLVLGVDSSAVAAMRDLAEKCRARIVKVCFSLSPHQHALRRLHDVFTKLEDHSAVTKTQMLQLGETRYLLAGRAEEEGKDANFHSQNRSATTRSSSNEHFQRSSEMFHVAHSLDSALAWCEDSLIVDMEPGRLIDEEMYMSLWAQHMRQLHALCPPDTPAESVEQLISFFTAETLQRDQVLWRQGDTSDKAVLVVSGQLLHSIEEEAGTTEIIEVGHLVGEMGVITMQRRHGTLKAVEESTVYSLSREAWKDMMREEPHLALLLSQISMGYLGRRAMHASNRIWESRCIPV